MTPVDLVCPDQIHLDQIYSDSTTDIDVHADSVCASSGVTPVAGSVSRGQQCTAAGVCSVCGTGAIVILCLIDAHAQQPLTFV